MARKIPQNVRHIQENPPQEINYAFEKNISYSQASIYNQCPKRWALHYRDGHKVYDPSIHAVFGTAIHEALQEYLEVMYAESGAAADRLPILDVFEDKFREEYKKTYKKHNKHFSTPKELKEFYDDGVAIIEDFKKLTGIKRNKDDTGLSIFIPEPHDDITAERIFKKYLNNPYKNMHLNFMNSLSPNNDYFLNNNIIPESTYKNIFCNFASQLTPYILVDGRVSACCRDYDGSLVVDDINQNSLGNIYKSEGFKNLHNAHINDDGSIEKYKLCKSCFVVDARINRIWNNVVALMLYNYPNKDAQFYQLILNELILNLKNLDSSSFNRFLNKFSLNK